MTYASCLIGTVLQCPITGDLFRRVFDAEPRGDWLATYVETAVLAGLAGEPAKDATELLATCDLPKTGLVLLEPVTAASATAPVVAEVDLGDEMDALVVAVFAPVAGVA